MFIAISIVTREHNFQGSVFSDTKAITKAKVKALANAKAKLTTSNARGANIAGLKSWIGIRGVAPRSNIIDVWISAKVVFPKSAIRIFVRGTIMAVRRLVCQFLTRSSILSEVDSPTVVSR